MAIFDPLRRKVQGEWGGSAHSPDPTAQSVDRARRKTRRHDPPAQPAIVGGGGAGGGEVGVWRVVGGRFVCPWQGPESELSCGAQRVTYVSVNSNSSG